jgi:hypothetical protein
MIGHEFVNAQLLAGKTPKAVFLDLEGKPDADELYPVIIVAKHDFDFRFVRSLRVFVSGIDAEAVYKIVQAVLRFSPSRVIANYLETSPIIVWDSEVDA